MDVISPKDYRYLVEEAQKLGKTLVGKIILIRPNLKEVLLLTRSEGNFSGKDEFPGGIILKNENLDRGATREVREETGVNADIHYAMNHIDYVTPKGEEIRQINFIYFIPEGKKYEDIKLSSEHQDWKWYNLGEVLYKNCTEVTMQIIKILRFQDLRILKIVFNNKNAWQYFTAKYFV